MICANFLGPLPHGGGGSLSGLMPYGNANQIVKEMAYEALPVVKNTPVLAGVCGTDPFMLPRQFLSELKELGFAGIQNFPTVGLVDGKLRQNLEETGISFQQEVEVVALAHEMDLLTTPYVFDEQETKWMTDAGADILVAHMGCTTGGTIGVSTATPLDECVERIRGMVDVARKIRKDVLMLCHGGRSRRLTTRSTSSHVEGSTASTARARWSGCRRRSR